MKINIGSKKKREKDKGIRKGARRNARHILCGHCVVKTSTDFVIFCSLRSYVGTVA
jgi:hypothetical protein